MGARHDQRLETPPLRDEVRPQIAVGLDPRELKRSRTEVAVERGLDERRPDLGDDGQVGNGGDHDRSRARRTRRRAVDRGRLYRAGLRARRRGHGLPFRMGHALRDHLCRRGHHVASGLEALPGHRGPASEEETRHEAEQHLRPRNRPDRDAARRRLHAFHRSGQRLRLGARRIVLLPQLRGVSLQRFHDRGQDRLAGDHRISRDARRLGGDLLFDRRDPALQRTEPGAGHGQQLLARRGEQGVQALDVGMPR